MWPNFAQLVAVYVYDLITPALMMGMDDIILDRIAFGGVKEIQEIYSE
jgi:hypothetical protein